MVEPRRTVILGAAGRDFHNFNVLYRDCPGHRVVAFTATQIPDIAGRTHPPPSLAGERYPDGIPIIDEAEREADVILWDGGNNDLPFYAPNLAIVLADPPRAGDETLYHPGEANVCMSDIVIVGKCDSASDEAIRAIEASVMDLNPRARILRCDSPVTVDDPDLVRGRRVIVVEDGPMLTHGSMSFGAGVVGARAAGVAEIVDPAPFATRSIATTYERYPNARGILPAMGYDEAQVRDLEATIEAADADAVVIGTPIDLTRVLRVGKPMTRARYELAERVPGSLAAAVRRTLGIP